MLDNPHKSRTADASTLTRHVSGAKGFALSKQFARFMWFGMWVALVSCLGCGL